MWPSVQSTETWNQFLGTAITSTHRRPGAEHILCTKDNLMLTQKGHLKLFLGLWTLWCCGGWRCLVLVLVIQRHIYIFTLVRPFSFAAQPCQIPYVLHMFAVIQDPLLAWVARVVATFLKAQGVVGFSLMVGASWCLHVLKLFLLQVLYLDSWVLNALGLLWQHNMC